MIPLLLQLDIAFDPAFAFPGERFAVVAPAPATVSAEGVTFRRVGDRVFGVAPERPLEVWATVGEPGAYTAAAMRVLPVALGSPMLVGEISVVPLHGGGYGAILADRRFADLVAFELSARDAPMRRREFNVSAVYQGPNRITLYGTVDGVLQATVTVEADGVRVDWVARFDLRGSLTVLGTRTPVAESAPGSAGSFFRPV